MKVKENYRNAIQILRQIQESYKKYVGEKSLYLLNCYINGFLRVIEFYNEPLCNEVRESIAEEMQELYDNFIEINDFFCVFQKWIEQKYSCMLSQSWCNILRFYSDTEEEAYELFYRELNLFCESDNFIKYIIESSTNDISNEYGNVHVLGEEIELIIFEKEQYNNIFYQYLWKILTMIRNAPFLIIGEKSLSLIKVYINGFINAYNMIDQKENLYEFFPGFEEWVNKKMRLNIYRSWHKIILFKSANEEEAFDLFYNYLEEYTGNKVR